MSGKYVIFDWNGLEYPVLLPNCNHFVGHDEIKARGEPISAGFFSIGENPAISIWGKSISLKLKSRPEDAGIITKHLTE